MKQGTLATAIDQYAGFEVTHGRCLHGDLLSMCLDLFIAHVELRLVRGVTTAPGASTLIRMSLPLRLTAKLRANERSGGVT
jgi:hypothetical protein